MKDKGVDPSCIEHLKFNPPILILATLEFFTIIQQIMTLKLIKNGKHQHWKLHTKLTFSSRDVIREEKRFSCLNFYYYTFVFYKQSILTIALKIV